MGLSTFPDTDLDRARDFVGRYGEDLRYCEELERWLVWDGTRWALGHTKDHLEVFRRAKRHAKGLEDRALAASDAGDRKDALSEAKRAQSAARIRATIDLAKSEPRVSLTSTNDLDRNPWLLNTIIGTIDLRTGKLLEHDREHLITQRIPFPYREAETTLRLVPEGGLTPRWEGGHACPTWFMFLEQAMGGKERLVSFLQRVVGYTLTGEVSEKAWFLLYGPPNSGKTTFLEALRLLMADFARVVDVNALLAGRGEERTRENLARLQGARLVTTAEPAKGRRLNEALVKVLTGGDKTEVRPLYRDPYEIDVHFKLFMATNDRPRVNSQDDASWVRIVPIPFEKEVSKQRQDPDLLSKLDSEMPDILGWAVQGCLDWQRREGLDPPKEVLEATDKYRAEMDVLGEYLEEECELGEGLEAGARQLHLGYNRYCDLTNRRDLRMNPRDFKAEMEARGFKQKRTKHGRVWLGVAQPGVSLRV